ncbi:RCC1 domain-containing protein [Arthrobacter humicola]
MSFADVPESSLFHKEISWLAAEGISTGWDVGGGVRQYRPLDRIARDAMAAFLYRKAGSPDYAPPASSPFSDVAPEAAFYKEITWLASEGISTGWDVGEGKREYRPMNPIARDAMAAFLYRFAKPVQFAAPAQSPFVDVAAGAAFYREITWLASSGISTGWDIGGGAREYRPLSGIARDAMAAFLYRYASEKVPTNPLDPAAGAVTVAPDVEVLEPTQLASALVTGSAMTLPSSEAAEINANDVLVAGVTAGTPEGLLARVVQVSRDPGGNTVVSLKPATLTEAIVSTSGLLEVAGTPASSSFTPEPNVTVTTNAVAASGAARTEALTAGEVFSESFSLKKTIKPAEVATEELRGSGFMTVESSIKASAKAKMTLEAGFLQLKEASVVLTPSFSSRHSVTVSGTLEGTASVKLGVLKAVIAFPTAIPIVVTAEAEVAANLSATGTAEVTYVTAHTVSSDVGFKYREGSFSLVNTKPQVTGVQNDVQTTASLIARLALDFDADIRFYGIAGITFGAGPYASAPLTVTASNGTQNWTCPIEIGFEARLGVVAGIEVMGFKLENRNEASAAWKLFEVNPCEGTPVRVPGSAVLAIQSTGLPFANAGTAYQATLAASGGTSPYAWTITTGSLPTGLTLNAASGTIDGTPTEAGSASFTVSVRDAKGATASRALTLNTSNGSAIAFGNVASGSSATLNSVYAVKNDGTLWSWGPSSALGIEGYASYPSPIKVGLTDVASVTAGYYAGYALKKDGTVWSWGTSNRTGQLGNGTTSENRVPAKVLGLTNVVSVEIGDQTAFALKQDGTVWAWGANSQGAMGNGTTTDSLAPAQVPGVTDVVAIEATDYRVHVLKRDGTVWGWGGNQYGALGDGTYKNSTVPVRVVGLDNVRAIETNGPNRSVDTLALKNDGTVWSWGGGWAGNGSASIVPVQVSGLTNVTKVLSGEGNGYAVKADGTVWAWGSNRYGQLGNGTTQDAWVPVQVPGIDAVDLSKASITVFAVRGDGTVWSWGGGRDGVLGNGEATEIATLPVRVAALQNVSSVFGSSDSAYAITKTGELWAWGANRTGQLGVGSTTNSAIPLKVKG